MLCRSQLLNLFLPIRICVRNPPPHYECQSAMATFPPLEHLIFIHSTSRTRTLHTDKEEDPDNSVKTRRAKMKVETTPRRPSATCERPWFCQLRLRHKVGKFSSGNIQSNVPHFSSGLPLIIFVEIHPAISNFELRRSSSTYGLPGYFTLHLIL